MNSLTGIKGLRRLDSKEQKIFDDAFETAKRTIECSAPSGLIIEKSPCCGADVTYTEGGLKLKICSACKSEVREQFF